ADHERAQGAEIEVDRDGRGRVEQRVARAEEADVVADLHRRPPPAAGESAAGDGQVERAGGLDEYGERRRASADGVRELAEDPLGLVALRGRGLRLAVVQ